MPRDLSIPDDDYHASLSEIAKELGICRQQVLEIQKKALRKIAPLLLEYRDHEPTDSGEGDFCGRFIDGLDPMGDRWE